MSKQQGVTINIYLDYAPEDEIFAKDVLKHLSFIAYEFQNHQIDIWHHGLIRAGQRRDVLQAAALGKADIVLMVVSASYLTSPNYQAYESEFIRMCESGDVVFIPILAKTSMWHFSPFGRFGLKSLPSKKKTILEYRHKAEAYTEIVQALVPVIADKIENKPKEKAKFENDVPKQDFKAHIQYLIAENEAKKAFEEIDKLLKYSNDNKLKQYFALFKSRYLRAENDMINSIITTENMHIEHNKILLGLMASLDKIPEEISEKWEKDETTIIHSNKNTDLKKDAPENNTNIDATITSNGKGNLNFVGTKGDINLTVNNDFSTKNKKEEKSPPTKEKEKKVLMYIQSCPIDKGLIVFFQQEKDAIVTKLKLSRESQNIKVVEKTGVKTADFSDTLINYSANYIHIASHSDEKGIVLQGKDNKAEHFTVKMLKRLFKKLHKEKKPIQFVFLASCASSQHAKIITQYVPYILSLQKPALDKFIPIFVEKFYAFFFASINDIEYAFEQACDEFDNKGNIYPELFINTNLISNYNKKEEYKDNNQIFYI